MWKAPYHLREVGKRRLTAVALPVRVRHETDRRIEGEIRAHRAEPLRVQREQVLKTKDRIGEEESRQAEQDQRRAVALPILLSSRADPEKPRQQPFKGFHHRIEKRSARRVQDMNEVASNRLRQERQEADKQGQLHPSVDIRHFATSVSRQNFSGWMTTARR